MNKIIKKNLYGWGLAGLLLLLTFGSYWICFPKKIAVYPNRPLLWRDFKQVSLISGRESIKALCISTTDFEVNRVYDNGRYKKIDLRVKIEQQKELSFVSTKFLAGANKATKEEVLHHENGHFKIAQIIGHRIVHAVDAFRFDPKNYQAQLDSIVRNNYKNWSLMDKEYDYATTNPRNKEKQKDWDLLFKRELETIGGK